MDYTDDFSFVNQYLVSGEYVLWKGKPEKGHIFSGRDLAVTVFSIFWLSFACFWEYIVLQNGAPWIFKLWGLPFIAIGLYMLFGRSLQKVFSKNKTFYVITNKKLIIKRGRHLEMYNGCDLPPMTIKLHKNGNGTITFCEDVYMRRGRTRTTYIELDNIADVAQAQNALGMMER